MICDFSNNRSIFCYNSYLDSSLWLFGQMSSVDSVQVPFLNILLFIPSTH